jgi:hypothetical protein
MAFPHFDINRGGILWPFLFSNYYITPHYIYTHTHTQMAATDFKCAVSIEKLVEAGLEYKGPPDKVECRQCPLVTTTATKTSSLVTRLGYEEKYILTAIDACRQRWNNGGA